MKPEARPDDQRHLLSEQERVKELRCLYAVSQIIVDPDLARPDRMRRIVRELASAWRFPDKALARITLDGQRFESPRYERVSTSQRASILVEGVRRGSVEVGYTSPSPPDGDDPFLREEKELLDNVARQVSLYITREEGSARRDVLEEELRHAERLATIGQLAAGVAHEMNDPLSSVLGLAQLALKSPGTPRSVSDDLHGIVAASLRAREIVKRLLLFARQTAPKKTPLNLNEVVEEGLFLLEAGCERQGIRLMLQLAKDLPTVEADAVQMRQVLVNLTVNAMQAIATEGTVLVETRLEAQHVVLSVSDSGHGMSREIMSKVFNPFFTTKDPGQGTGLGLSVVHGIVTSHGGTIDVESREGEGSRFIVRLPAAKDMGANAQGMT